MENLVANENSQELSKNFLPHRPKMCEGPDYPQRASRIETKALCLKEIILHICTLWDLGQDFPGLLACSDVPIVGGGLIIIPGFDRCNFHKFLRSFVYMQSPVARTADYEYAHARDNKGPNSQESLILHFGCRVQKETRLHS